MKGRTDIHPWLNKDNVMRNMSDREILEKYVHLEKIMSVRFRKGTSKLKCH